MHFIGIPVEPSKWNIQADYSIAEAGNTDTARKENKKLLKKKSTKLSEGKGRGLKLQNRRKCPNL